MAKLYVHGTVSKEYRKTLTTESGISFESVYRLMTDGKFLRKNGTRWNLVKFKNPLLTAGEFAGILKEKGYIEQ